MTYEEMARNGTENGARNDLLEMLHERIVGNHTIPLLAKSDHFGSPIFLRPPIPSDHCFYVIYALGFESGIISVKFRE